LIEYQRDHLQFDHGTFDDPLVAGTDVGAFTTLPVLRKPVDQLRTLVTMRVGARGVLQVREPARRRELKFSRRRHCLVPIEG